MVDVGTQNNARDEPCTVGDRGETCGKGEMCLALTRRCTGRPGACPMRYDLLGAAAACNPVFLEAWGWSMTGRGDRPHLPIHGESLMDKKMSRVHHSITNHRKYVVSCLLLLLLYCNQNANSIWFQTINEWEEGVWIRCCDPKEMQSASPSRTFLSCKDKAQTLDSMGSSVTLWHVVNLELCERWSIVYPYRVIQEQLRWHLLAVCFT